MKDHSTYFLTLGPDEGELLCLQSSCCTQVPIKRRMGETTASLNTLEKNPLPLPEIKPQFLGHADEYYGKL